ncbi:MAG TPA: hypothetical protein DEQ60_02640, partial [Methylophaga sp.]|nr:hypothetical protein [Methylophaga sp.]
YFDDAWNFSEGLSRVEKNAKVGYINTTGKMEIAPEYVWAYSFSNGLAVITHNYRQYGFINRQGDVVIEPQFEHAHPFNEGLAAIKIRDKWGYISKD